MTNYPAVLSRQRPVRNSLRLLDRHLLKSFLVPFALLLFGLIAIWLVADLANYFNDFLDAKVSTQALVNLYVSQLPSVLVLILPVCLLLALLYAIIRLAQANELLAMASTGVSQARIVTTFALVGFLLTAIMGALNYRLAPEADGAKARLIAELTNARDGDGKLKVERYDYAVGYLYANRQAGRLWFVQRLARRGNEPFRGVQVTQQDANGNIVAKFDSPSASYDGATGEWRLERPRVVQFDANGELIAERFPPVEIVRDWPETPSRIAAATQQAQSLGVPELREYLTLNSDGPDSQLAPFRTHLYYRFALPLSCLLLVLVAVPLGMNHARRGVIAGVAVALVIFLTQYFIDRLFLALGQGSRIPPFWAAWGPTLLLAVVALLLLRWRSLNRDRLLTSAGGIRHFFGLG